MDQNGDGEYDWQDDYLTQKMIDGDSSKKANARWTHHQPWYTFGCNHLYYFCHSLFFSNMHGISGCYRFTDRHWYLGLFLCKVVA